MNHHEDAHVDHHAEQVFGEAAQEATETLEGEVVSGTTTEESRKQFGEDATKFVVDAGYAIAGLAGLVGEKAKAFYDEQKSEYAKTHPDTDAPGARQFFEQLGAHLNKFVDEINRGFRELSEKGREVVKKKADEASDAAEKVAEVVEEEQPSGE